MIQCEYIVWWEGRKQVDMSKEFYDFLKHDTNNSLKKCVWDFNFYRYDLTLE